MRVYITQNNRCFVHWSWAARSNKCRIGRRELYLALEGYAAIFLGRFFNQEFLLIFSEQLNFMNPDKYAEAEYELERQVVATFHHGILTVVWWMKFTVIAWAEAGITGTHESTVELWNVKCSLLSSEISVLGCWLFLMLPIWVVTLVVHS